MAQRLVRAGGVVLLDVARDEPAELGRRFVLADPHALALEAAEPPLHDHVVSTAGLDVYASEHGLDALLADLDRFGFGHTGRTLIFFMRPVRHWRLWAL